MGFTVLERSLITERHPEKMVTNYYASTLAPKSSGFAVPTMMDRLMDKADNPLLVTNARRTFVSTKLSKQSRARFGFSAIEAGDDDLLLPELFKSLWGLSEASGWTNRCTSLQGGLTRMASLGLEPHSVVLSYDLAQKILGVDFNRESVAKAMATKGHVTIANRVLIRVAELPSNQAIIFTAPPMVGFLTRVGDYLGVLLRGVDQSIVLVQDAVA